MKIKAKSDRLGIMFRLKTRVLTNHDLQGWLG